MNIVNAGEAREKLYLLLDETASDHEPVLITGPRSNAILVGEEDWNAIQETLHLLSVPGIVTGHDKYRLHSQIVFPRSHIASPRQDGAVREGFGAPFGRSPHLNAQGRAPELHLRNQSVPGCRGATRSAAPNAHSHA